MASDKISATVSVPASTSNLGPGFDVLGLALNLHNRIRVRRASGGQTSGDPFFQEAISAFFSACGRQEFAVEVEISGEVPRSRGLGSSVTVRMGILHGLNSLVGDPLEKTDLFKICSELEGHPDNAAPAAFGGFVVCRQDGGWSRFAVGPELSFVLLIPEMEFSTESARKVVPTDFSRADAVFNMANTATIAAAFASGRYDLLAGAFEDRFHQRQRGAFLPFLPDVIESGRAAGALGGWLSGSGSTVACVTQNAPETVAKQMLAAFHSHSPDVPARTEIVHADNEGSRLLEN